MSEFNFKSQICTAREQSERLLALGLKPETADMSYTAIVVNHKVDYRLDCSTPKSIDIPAWSLHRLIEMKQPNKIENAVVVLSREQTYDKLIGMIAKSIKEGHFQKEYLVDQAEIEEHCKGVLEYLDYIREEE